MAADLNRDVSPIRIQDVKRIVVYIRHRLFRLDMIVPAHIPYACLRAAHQDQKQPALDLSSFQMLFGNVVLSFSGCAIHHGNLVSLGIGAYAAAEATRQTHQVVVVEGLIGAG